MASCRGGRLNAYQEEFVIRHEMQVHQGDEIDEMLHRSVDGLKDD